MEISTGKTLSILNFKRPVLRFWFKTIVISLVTLGLYLPIGNKATSDIALYAMHFKMRVLKEKTPYDVLIMGDSRPMAIGWHQPRNAYNLSLPSFGDIYPWEYMLKEYVKFHGPPKAILLSIIPETFYQTFDVIPDRQTAELFPAREILKHYFDRGDWATGIRILKKHYDRGGRVLSGLTHPAERWMLDKKTGALIFSPEKKFSYPSSGRFLRLKQSSSPLALSAVRCAELESFAKTAQRFNIPVLLYFMPIPKEVYLHDADFYRAFRQDLPLLRKRIPWLKIAEPYPADDLWPNALFCDESHLNREGSLYFEKHRLPELVAREPTGNLRDVVSHRPP